MTQSDVKILLLLILCWKLFKYYFHIARRWCVLGIYLIYIKVKHNLQLKNLFFFANFSTFYMRKSKLCFSKSFQHLHHPNKRYCGFVCKWELIYYIHECETCSYIYKYFPTIFLKLFFQRNFCSPNRILCRYKKIHIVWWLFVVLLRILLFRSLVVSSLLHPYSARNVFIFISFFHQSCLKKRKLFAIQLW